MSAYAGIGSRDTPAEILELMEQIAYKLAAGHNLRSGGALGADDAFTKGAVYAGASGGGGIEIYLPWPTFNDWHADPDDAYMVAKWSPTPAAIAIAERLHPGHNLRDSVLRLHGRNVHIILGADVEQPDPVKFVICWTQDGLGLGGTGGALRVAYEHNIPVFDLFIPDARRRIERWLDSEPGAV